MAMAVPSASLTFPRGGAASARRSGTPSLVKRHCAVRPVAAACSTPPPRQRGNGWYPATHRSWPEGWSLSFSPLDRLIDVAGAEDEGSGRRQVLVAGGAAAAAFLSRPNPAAFAAEAKKGFLPVTDKKAGYSFLYPFGWQEVAVQGQDKVYKDVIEPLESVSINTISTSKQDIRELGPPDKVAEALIQKVLAPSTQKTKLIEAKENEVDGRAYYTFEFTAQAPNYTRHALGAIAIGNDLQILHTDNWSKREEMGQNEG
ncbi:hypothetical protein ACP70R_050401 [Stipagrostis hirtigluma subsp. patula]